jgi:hypothetical protein
MKIKVFLESTRSDVCGLLGSPKGRAGVGSLVISHVANKPETTMKTLILAAIRCSLMFTAVTASLFFVRPAQAYTVTLEQVGSNVVANGSGAINLTGLAFSIHLPGDPFINAVAGVINTGLAGGRFRYSGATGPTSFGSGGVFLPNTSSGDLVGIAGNVQIPGGPCRGSYRARGLCFQFCSIG